MYFQVTSGILKKEIPHFIIMEVHMKYVCTVCGYVYDEDKEEIPFDKLPDDYECPLCGVSKENFEKEEE